MDDIVIVYSATEDEPRTVEYVQVKTTTKDSLWSCSRLCGSANDAPGSSVFEKSLSRDCSKEHALFRIVTTQAVQSALRPLTFPRGNSSRSLTTEEMVSLHADMDARCPGAQAPKGTTSKDWLERVLWVVGAPQETLRKNVLYDIMKRSIADEKQGLFLDQAERVLDALLSWIREAGDAKFVPDKDKKIIPRAKLISWWHAQIQKERDGVHVTSGGKLRGKMTPDVASEDMVESALEFRRKYAEEVRAPKYLDGKEIEKVAMDVQASLMQLRTRRFTGEINEGPSDFHQRCQATANAVAENFAGGDRVPSAIALGCFYDIVDRCQLTFSGEDK